MYGSSRARDRGGGGEDGWMKGGLGSELRGEANTSLTDREGSSRIPWD